MVAGRLYDERLLQQCNVRVSDDSLFEMQQRYHGPSMVPIAAGVLGNK